MLIETKLLHLRGSLKLLYANKVGCGFSFVGIPSTKCREHTCINDIIRYIVVLQKTQMELQTSQIHTPSSWTVIKLPCDVSVGRNLSDVANSTMLAYFLDPSSALGRERTLRLSCIHIFPFSVCLHDNPQQHNSDAF